MALRRAKGTFIEFYPCRGRQGGGARPLLPDQRRSGTACTRRSPMNGVTTPAVRLYLFRSGTVQNFKRFISVAENVPLYVT